MAFNPWAIAVFLIGGLFLFGSGLSNTFVATAFFLLLAPTWILCGYVWDKLTIPEPPPVCLGGESNIHTVDCKCR